MNSYEPDQRTRLPTPGHDVVIDHWRGLFRDEIRVYWDVRPCLGGLIGSHTVWRRRGDSFYAEMVQKVAHEITIP